MASILRSGKLLRYFTGFTRSARINSARESEGSLLQSSACICNQLHQGFANAAVPKTDFGLEKQLRRLDNDVRRVGRISRRDIEDVLEEIRLQRSATSSQSLLVIRCCGNLVPEEMPEVRTALVQEIWKTLNTLKVPMDISHYNALLRVYLENEHPFSPTEFLSELEAKSIEPNRVTYQRLIARYCQQGDIEGATRILEFMREKNLPVNENVFNSLILGHSQANDMESAKGILAVMKQAGLHPSADTYSTLLSCYARYGDIDAITSTIEDCEKQEIFLLDRDLLDAVYNLAINGHSDKIDTLLGKMRLSAGFNQDAVSTILRLVNKGYEDVGLKILRMMPRTTRADGQLIDAGVFFIKQLVKANRPIDKVLSICKILQDEGLNTKAITIATEAGLINGKPKSALSLLKEMKNSGLPIRQHYFWPIICSVEHHQIIDVIHQMRENFELLPNSETLRDYVIPNLKEKNWEKVINLLRDAGTSTAVAASSTAYVALASQKFEEAVQIMESHRAYYPPQLFRQALIQALSKTNNYAAFVRVVRQINDNAYRFNRVSSQEQQSPKEPLLEVGEEAEDTSVEIAETESAQLGNKQQIDFVGQIVLDAYGYFRNDRLVVLDQILTELVQQGLSMSRKHASRLSELLGSQMTPNISELLGKLSSGQLEPVELKNSSSYRRSVETMTVEELERLIERIEAKNESANNLKKILLIACFRSKNLTKTLQVIEKLESEDYKLNDGVWAQLIELYTHHAKLTEALELYEKLKKNNPDFIIDNIKTIRVVGLLLEEDRFDEALSFLERNKKPQLLSDDETSSNYISTIWRVLNKLAEKGDDEKLQKIFDALINGNYVLPKNVILGPLVKVHLVRDNLQKAMEVFEHICETYNSTPWKNELTCRLIQKEDAANLQKLTDLSTTVHGEVNSLYDLVFSFIECGRIRQARKILETPGLRARPHRIDNACERYKNEGLVEPLERLVEATKDLHHIDRNNIYYTLLLSYCKAEDAEKALGLWTKMQEEDVTPSDAFLLKLAELLKSKNIEIPFVIPQQEQSIWSDTKKSESNQTHPNQTNLKRLRQSSSSNIYNFRKAIESGDVDTAIQIKNNLRTNEELSITDVSYLIEELLRASRLNEATKLVNELLVKKQQPRTNVFRFYLNAVCATGDVKTMQEIGDQLTDENKKLLSFENRICNAYIMAGEAENFMDTMLHDIKNAKSAEEISKLESKFPRGGALGILEKHPEFKQKFEELAEIYFKSNIISPANVLWMHLMTTGDEEAAKSIFEKYLKNVPRLMFQRILKVAREQNNEELVQKTINQLRSSSISEGARGNAYSCLIDVQIANEKYDEALMTLNDAVKDVCLENINRTALERLKSAVESTNKQFPYTIPPKKSSNNAISSSSASGSDDDVTPKRPETRPSKPKTE